MKKLLILPVLLLLLGVLLLSNIKSGTKIVETQPKEKGELELGVLRPSQLLANRLKYKDQELTIRGKISQVAVVCERKECPKEDPCCGCKEERNLIIIDAERVFVKETTWQLRLLSPGGKAFCQRLPNSCKYDCPGWEMESVYDVSGTFFAEPPPQGTSWRMFFDFYFEVEEKSLVEETEVVGLPERLFKGIQELIKKYLTSGSYVLP